MDASSAAESLRTAESRLERAFVAMSYLLGERGELLGALPLGSEAQKVMNALSHSEQSVRVAALAVEVARIAVALEEGAVE